MSSFYFVLDSPFVSGLRRVGAVLYFTFLFVLCMAPISVFYLKLASEGSFLPSPKLPWLDFVESGLQDGRL